MLIEAAILAVGCGARIVEKHFTIAKDRSDFRDHQLSADPEELTELVRRIRQAVELLGHGRLELAASERAAVTAARRSIVAVRDLAAGTVLSWDDFSWVRPAIGLVPGSEAELLGKRLVRSIAKGDPIRMEDVQD